jgi:hypothetical protein
LFAQSRRLGLDDGRTLVVQFQGARHGWGAYIPGGTDRPVSADTPAEAIAGYLGYSPAWADQVSESLLRDLAEAPRYACDCCGFRTLLNPGYYDICPVCFWEDDRCDTGRWRDGPDAPSGPNRISLTEARANFTRSGACDERARPHVRAPRPHEYPTEGGEVSASRPGRI